MDRTHLAWNAVSCTVVIIMLLTCSFTASGYQAVDPVPEKERTRGDFTANISLAFPVFSSGPETFGYEAVGLGYTFLNNNLEAGINFGGLVTKGTIYTHSKMKGMVMGTAPSIRSPSRPEPCSVLARRCSTVLLNGFIRV